MITDWNIYKLIIFNLIHNSIIYNPIEGDIVILLQVKEVVDIRRDDFVLNQSLHSSYCQKMIVNEPDNKHYILKTEIIDNGNGINKER
jgi:signal transduction histidine kinase